METFSFQDGFSLKVGTVYCIGKNYAAHAREMGDPVPKAPVVFIKPPAALLPSGGVVHPPVFSQCVHHEVELVVVIGRNADAIAPDAARQVIAGYAVGIDMTLRDVQLAAKKNGEPWAVAKGFVTSAPISTVVPASRFGAAPTFTISLSVNGQQRQNGTTSSMERTVEELVSYISHVFTLKAGDCIFTGTPEGVGAVATGDALRATLEGFVDLDVVIGSPRTL